MVIGTLPRRVEPVFQLGSDPSCNRHSDQDLILAIVSSGSGPTGLTLR